MKIVRWRNVDEIKPKTIVLTGNYVNKVISLE